MVEDEDGGLVAPRSWYAEDLSRRLAEVFDHYGMDPSGCRWFEMADDALAAAEDSRGSHSPASLAVWALEHIAAFGRSANAEALEQRVVHLEACMANGAALDLAKRLEYLEGAMAIGAEEVQGAELAVGPGPLSVNADGDDPAVVALGLLVESLLRANAPQGFAAATGHATIGAARYAAGITSTIAKGPTLTSPSVFGWFDPAGTTAAKRYNLPAGAKGSPAGERAIWHYKALFVATHSSNPLGLADPAAVARTWGQSAYFDGVDPLYIRKPGAQACDFDAYFVPKYAELYGPDPVQPPKDKPVDPPKADPPKQPEPPKPTVPPVTTAEQRAAELTSKALATLRKLPAGPLASWCIAAVEEWGPPLWARAVEIYRARAPK